MRGLLFGLEGADVVVAMFLGMIAVGVDHYTPQVRLQDASDNAVA